MLFCVLDGINHHQTRAVWDRESKRNGFGFSQGVGYDSRNKLKDLLRKDQRQHEAETKYVDQWNGKFEELFGKSSSNSKRLQNRSKVNDPRNGFQASIRQVFVATNV